MWWKILLVYWLIGGILALTKIVKNHDTFVELFPVFAQWSKFQRYSLCIVGSFTSGGISFPLIIYGWYQTWKIKKLTKEKEHLEKGIQNLKVYRNNH